MRRRCFKDVRFVFVYSSKTFKRYLGFSKRTWVLITLGGAAEYNMNDPVCVA